MLLWKGGGHQVRAGLHRKRDVEVLVDRVMRLVPRRGLAREQLDALAVEREFNCVGFGEAFDVLITVAGEAHLTVVVAVDGKV